MHKGAHDGEIGFPHTLFYCQTGLFVPRIHVDAAIRHMNDILGFLSPTDFSFSKLELQRPPPIAIDDHLLLLQCAQI